MKRRPPPLPLLGAAALVLLLAAGGCGGGGGGTPPPLSGRVVFTGPPKPEAEPNSTVDAAEGPLALDERSAWRLEGEVGAPGDPFDAFAVTSAERRDVRVRVATAEGPGRARAALYDPATLQVLAEDEDGVLAFALAGTLHLVVRGEGGPCAWRLAVDPDDAAAGGAPATTAAPRVLGRLAPGEVVRLDGPGRWLLFLPAACDLVADAGTLAAADASAGVARPVPLGALRPGSPLPLAPGSLVRLDASTAGAVRVEARAPSPEARGLRRETPRRVAALAEEGLTRPSADEAPYGRPRFTMSAGRGLVRVRPGEEAAARDAIEAQGGRVVEENPGICWVVEVPIAASAPTEEATRATWGALASLGDEPALARAEPSWQRRPFLVPDDPRYPEQWHYPLIGLPDAWDITTGDPDLVVAVIDTGSTAHPDLAGRFLPGYDFIRDPIASGDGDGRDPDPTDPGPHGFSGPPPTFHGTHVAGTIGAATDNGIGVAGVAWGCRLLPCRALTEAAGDDADLIAALLWASGLPNATGTLPPEPARVVNMSLGGAAYSSVFEAACTAARDAGVLLVAARGNDGNTVAHYPASYAAVMSVGAVGPTLERPAYASYGDDMDLVAPGGDLSKGPTSGVLSTIYDTSDPPPVPSYGFYNGTSMATPHVTGVAALVLSVDPALRPDDLAALLRDTAQDLGAPGRDPVFGAGLLDAYAAVLAARDGLQGPHARLATSAVALDREQPSAFVAVESVGTEPLVVDEAVVLEPEAAAWLASSLVGSGDATRNVDGIRVDADPTGLPDGDRSATVVVRSNGPDVWLRVRLHVGTPTVEIHVLVIDALTDQVVATRTLAPGGDGRFAFPDLAAGTYRVVAGSDEDGDGLVAEPADWGGAWFDGGGDVLEVGGAAGPRSIVVPVVRPPTIPPRQLPPP